MPELSVGDIVRIKGDKTNYPFTVDAVYSNGDFSILEMEHYNRFSGYLAEIIEKCRYKDGDRVRLIAVYWHEESREFEEREIMGTVDGGGIKFDKRTFDYYDIPVYDLNHILHGDTFGCDCNCAFCEPDEKKIRDAKLEYLDDLTCAFEDAKKDYEDFETQLKTMRKLLGVK